MKLVAVAQFLEKERHAEEFCFNNRTTVEKLYSIKFLYIKIPIKYLISVSLEIRALCVFCKKTKTKTKSGIGTSLIYAGNEANFPKKMSN